jgi:SAM-dependent methyltransferase
VDARPVGENAFDDRLFLWGKTNRDPEAMKRTVEGRVEVWEHVLYRNRLAPKSVLDIGCHDGALAELMANRGVGSEFTLADLSESAISHIRQSPFPGLVDAVVSDASALPYADKSFDLAVLSHIVEHVPHPRDVVVEAARVSQVVLVEVPLQDAIFSNLAAIIAKYKTGTPRSFNPVGHLHFFSDRTFRTAMTMLGELAIVDSEAYFPPNRGQAKRLLDHLGKSIYGRLLQLNAVYLVTSPD